MSEPACRPVILIGGSAPELGGLRETVTDPLTPSVQIQADAVEQIMAGRFPRAIGAAERSQLSSIVALGVLALAPARRFRRSSGAASSSQRSCSPGRPDRRRRSYRSPGGSAASVVRRRAGLRHRFGHLVRGDASAGGARAPAFEQHLAPAVVRRIVEQPGLDEAPRRAPRGDGAVHRRRGFTAMTHRANPEG